MDYSNITMPTSAGPIVNEVGRNKTVELIQQYCSSINYNIIIIIGIAMLMWILEGAFRKIVEKKLNEHLDSEPQVKEISNFIFRIYKMIGVGILFMAAFSIWWV